MFQPDILGATSTLLIIDEIGYQPMSREQANLFFQAVRAPLRTRLCDDCFCL